MAASSAEWVVGIAGLSLSLPSVGPPLASAALRDLFAKLADGREPADIRVRFTDAPLRAPTSEATVAWPGLAAHLDDEGATVTSAGITARVERSEVVLAGDSAAAHRVLPLALAQALLPHARFVVHAALVVRGDEAVLVVAPTGTGKSTVAYAARAAGWSVGSDDLTVVRAGPPGTVIAAGVPREGRVPIDVAGDGGEAVPGDGRPRRALDLAEVARDAPVTAVASLSWSDDARGGIDPLSAADAMDLLLGSSFAIGPVALRAWFPLAGALARRPAGRIRLGADPAHRAADAATALDDLVAGGHQ